MKLFFLMILAAVPLVITAALPAMAQQSAPAQMSIEQKAPGQTTSQKMTPEQAAAEKARKEKINKIYAQLPPEDQERLIDETMQVEAYCNKRETFALLHDCRCVAVKFLDERILRPDPGHFIIGIADDVADGCPNIPGAAGYAFNSCKSIHAGMKFGLEDYCTCYARKFAELFEEAPTSSFPGLAKYRATALGHCNKQGIPSPGNPYGE